MKVLEKESTINYQCTILNMLEYMSVLKQYDGQIELVKCIVQTKENKSVNKKRVVMYVLDCIIYKYSLLD